MFKINYIENKDRQGLRSLLETENLCFNDISAIGVQIFEVKSTENIVGYFGYELYGTYALFRSMVVVPDYRKKGFGTIVWNEARKMLINEKVEDVFLLTNTAAPFFKNQGFAVVPRSSAPKDIASTTEFIEFCPGDSVCMMINLTE